MPESDIIQDLQSFADGDLNQVDQANLARRLEADSTGDAALDEFLSMESLLIAAHQPEPEPGAVVQAIQQRSRMRVALGSTARFYVSCRPKRATRSDSLSFGRRPVHTPLPHPRTLMRAFIP